METGDLKIRWIDGRLRQQTEETAIHITQANPHSLVVSFAAGSVPPDGTAYDAVELEPPGKLVRLGPCRFEAIADDERGHGRLVFTNQVYDFSNLFKRGTLVDVKTKFQQLSLLLGYKEHVERPFRDYTADLTYDLQVFRMLYDEVDRASERESPQTRDQIQRQILDAEGQQFFQFLDQKLAELEPLVAEFGKIQHERHGFYFRRQVWDVIMASAFLARTNLRPRGYAGDSLMMQQIYRNEYEGETIFARLMHKHPIETAAAQAVRNRRTRIAEEIAQSAEEVGESVRPLRFMSVACGPAWELRDLFSAREDLERYECVLLDQDPEALLEAQAGVRAVERRLGGAMQGQFIKDSVRTMLRASDLQTRWGRFHLIYSMGLFDYLTQPVARAVLERLYSLLHPGGKLIIGNFHVNNPTRHYMAYWMDWTLIYRSEESLVDLATSLPGASISVGFEQTDSQMFMTVRKR